MRLTGFVLALVIICGCAAKEPENSASDIGRETVPVVLKGTDDSVMVKMTAIVTDDDYYKAGSSDETEARGKVTLRARTATTTPDDNQHYFSGRVVYKDGTTIECDEGRSHIWSDFAVYEVIELGCDMYVLPWEVKTFELDLS